MVVVLVSTVMVVVVSGTTVVVVVGCVVVVGIELVLVEDDVEIDEVVVDPYNKQTMSD